MDPQSDEAIGYYRAALAIRPDNPGVYLNLGLALSGLKRPAVQQAMRAAIAAPLEVMRACAAAAEQGVVIAGFGNRSAWSDVQVGLELLNAGLRGAKLNAEINVEKVKDADYAAGVRSDVAEFERAIAHETSAAIRSLKA